MNVLIKKIRAIILSFQYRIRLHSDPESVHSMYLGRAIRDAFGSWKDKQLEVALDYGCGDCPYQKEIMRVARVVVTADIDNNPLASVCLDPSGTLPMPDESVDLVVSFQVLEHVADFEFYLHEAARVCRKGGWLLISAPSVWPFHPHPNDFRRWMFSGLEYDLRMAGFIVNRHWAILNPVATAFQYLLSVCRYRLWHRRGGRWVALLLGLIFNPCILLCEKCFKSTYSLGAGNYVLIAKRE